MAGRHAVVGAVPAFVLLQSAVSGRAGILLAAIACTGLLVREARRRRRARSAWRGSLGEGRSRRIVRHRSVGARRVRVRRSRITGAGGFDGAVLRSEGRLALPTDDEFAGRKPRRKENATQEAANYHLTRPSARDASFTDGRDGASDFLEVSTR